MVRFFDYMSTFYSVYSVLYLKSNQNQPTLLEIFVKKGFKYKSALVINAYYSGNILIFTNK